MRLKRRPDGLQWYAWQRHYAPHKASARRRVLACDPVVVRARPLLTNRVSERRTARPGAVDRHGNTPQRQPSRPHHTIGRHVETHDSTTTSNTSHRSIHLNLQL